MANYSESVQMGNYLTIRVLRFIQEELDSRPYDRTAIATFIEEIPDSIIDMAYAHVMRTNTKIKDCVFHY